jgi:hypothetical protein
MFKCTGREVMFTLCSLGDVVFECTGGEVLGYAGAGRCVSAGWRGGGPTRAASAATAAATTGRTMRNERRCTAAAQFVYL